MSKTNATLFQAGHILKLADQHNRTKEQLDELFKSGLLSDLFSVDGYKGIDRKAFRTFLKAETPITETQETSLLEEIKKVAVSGADRFEPSKVIKVDLTATAVVKIGYIDPKVQAVMSGVVEENISATELTLHRLTTKSKLQPVFKELGDRAATSWKHFFEMLSRQARGEHGDLRVDGWVNFAFLPDKSGKLWAVCAYWRDWRVGDRWEVGAVPIEVAYGWGPGNRFVSC